MREPAAWEIDWKIRHLAADASGKPVDEITLDSRFIEDLDIDSLGITELAMDVEDAFGFDIPDEVLKEAFTRSPATLRVFFTIVTDRIPTGKRTAQTTPTPSSDQPLEEAPFTQIGPSPLSGGVSDSLYEDGVENREGYVEYRRKTDGMRCILIPAGLAAIGADAEPDQCPAHEVRLNAFLIDAEPVSNAAYARFLNSVEADDATIRLWCGPNDGDKRQAHFPLRRNRRGWKPVPGTDHRPMILVSWYGANAYALWAHGKQCSLYESDAAQLPSEAQWEYAASGACFETAVVGKHLRGVEYSAESLPSASVSERSGMSRFGLHHAVGNVWQWCRDWYSPEFYASPEALLDDPEALIPTGIRAERGGSWVGPAELASPRYRRGRPPIAKGRCLGFRCCASEIPR